MLAEGDTNAEFQSAPRAGARGDTNNAPLAIAKIKFQSAPRAGARGDGQLRRWDRRLERFNPLPARVRGEIGIASNATTGVTVSIRSPRGCAGRYIDKKLGRDYKKFQSAPRAGARGDFNAETSVVAANSFQSAPRAGARGDRRLGVSMWSVNRFNPLPARVRGEIY